METCSLNARVARKMRNDDGERRGRLVVSFPARDTRAGENEVNEPPTATSDSVSLDLSALASNFCASNDLSYTLFSAHFNRGISARPINYRVSFPEFRFQPRYGNNSSNGDPSCSPSTDRSSSPPLPFPSADQNFHRANLIERIVALRSPFLRVYNNPVITMRSSVETARVFEQRGPTGD